jgi:hypothetical protein
MDIIRKQRGHTSTMCRLIVLTAALLICRIAHAEDETTATSIVASSLSNSSTATSGVGQSQLFGVGRSVRIPENFPFGSQLQVISSPSKDGAIRIASDLTSVHPAAENEGTTDQAPAPPQSGRTQSKIDREARRLQLGVRAGVALDPELILIGVQSQLGPIFRSNVFFRPSVEFGYGEVTAMFGLNGEFIYRLPMSSPQDRWSTYFGAGLGVNLLHQNFERDAGGKRIDFGDFHSDSALNILGGVRYRSGMFVELRTSVYSDPSPTLRLIVGYNF